MYNALFKSILLVLFFTLSVVAYRGKKYSDKPSKNLRGSINPKGKKTQESARPYPITTANSLHSPYITTDKANEVVLLPHPIEPINSFPRTNCPQEDPNLLDWHINSTWNGFIPKSGDVTLPNNSRIIIRQSVNEILGTVIIPSTSELIFGEIENGITFDAQGMEVRGKLTIGSETCRFETPVTITLHGNRPSDIVSNARPPSFKGISVTGKLSLHGKRFYRTWTRLARTVEPGDNVIFLQDKVNWMSNQQIVLVTTSMKDSREWHRNEISIIESVVENPVPGVGAAVILRDPVSYQHLANSGYQGEVGLLSRQIIVQGNEASEPTDPDPRNCITKRSIFGDNRQPCANTELTGFGGHIMIHSGGKGYVEGVELYRMGQTNVLGRYPMHFHLLEKGCSDCYFRDSSVHRSFYRCVSIHGTHNIIVSENVAYNATGFCYYLEDGVERNNRIEFNLGAHIHMLGPEPPWGNGQKIHSFTQNENLTLPADVSASAFYITNVHNYIIGNAASGGWSGFAFPVLQEPTGPYRGAKLRPPLSETSLMIDGNTAHSTSWWWKHSAGFYMGGALFYNEDDVLEYNAGRDLTRPKRSPCLVDKCKTGHKNNCREYCQPYEQAWLKMTNTKAFLVAGVGLNSWNGRTEIIGYECHDCGLFLEALSTDGFWGHDMLGVCRSKTPLVLPRGVKASRIPGNGFRWYDTGQEHILANVTFRNCGYRSDDYNQYNKDPERGCGDEDDIGCEKKSSAWSFVTHSDQFVPEIMQATKSITFENCGRYFYYHDFRRKTTSSNSGRLQNWFDSDGSITGLGGPSVVASGLTDAGMWWSVDNKVVSDIQGPLKFFELNANRGLGHFRIKWDDDLHRQVGDTQCGNGKDIPCDYVGYIKHMGKYYANDAGLPVTASADIVGPVGGFGWKLELNGGAPKSARFEEVEVDPSTPMLLSIAYPKGTNFTIVAHAAWCKEATADFSCTETFYQVSSIKDVRFGIGNTYYVDKQGVLTIKIVQIPKTFVGRPEFVLPQYDDIGKGGKGYALPRFERDGIRLPQRTKSNYLSLEADCVSTGAYCSEIPSIYEPTVCFIGFHQTGYDHCSFNMVNGRIARYYADFSWVILSP